MRRILIQSLPFIVLVALVLGGLGGVRWILSLPFRAANDRLHLEEAPFNLDLLIPAGIYINSEMTVGEVLKLKVRGHRNLLERSVRYLARVAPRRCLYLADLGLFLFWSLSFLTVFRLFTLVGYGRAARGALLLGGITYYFMPDFSPGRGDDAAFLVFPLLVIVSRLVWRRARQRSATRRARGA